MKRKLAMILAVVMLLGMVLPQMAMAAPAGTYYISVSIKGPDAAGIEKTVTATSGTGSEDTLLAAEVVALVNAKKTAIETAFTGTGLRDILEAGVTAFSADGSAWDDYVNANISSVTGDFKNTLSNKSSTYSALEANTPNVVTYTVDANTYTVTVTLEPYTPPYTPPISDNSTTETEETVQNPDGSVTTIVTDKTTGTVTEATEYPNGVTGTTVTDKEGNITDISVDIPESAIEEAAKTGEAITLPVTLPDAGDSQDVPAVNVTLPSGVESVKVKLPVNESNPGLVAVIVDENGNETIVPKSVVTEDGVGLELDGSANVKIIDNSKDFEDMPDEHWADDAVAFVSARELFQGVTDTNFAPESPMTRGMMVTVLHRLESEPNVDFETVFDDVQQNAYYTAGVCWAADNGIVDGYEDGSYRPEDTVSRQELVAMLYRYAGEPAVADNALDFADADEIDAYAENAMRWAVDTGIVEGVTDDTLCPLNMATRAQVATMLMRFCNYMMNK